MSEDLAIATNDRVDLKEGVVERIFEQEILALQGLVLLGHQVSSRANRRPNPFPPVNSQMVTVAFDTAPSDQVHPDKSDDSYKTTNFKESDDDLNAFNYRDEAPGRIRPT